MEFKLLSPPLFGRTGMSLTLRKSFFLSLFSWLIVIEVDVASSRWLCLEGLRLLLAFSSSRMLPWLHSFYSHAEYNAHFHYLLVYSQQPPTFAWPGMSSWKVGCWLPKDLWFFENCQYWQCGVSRLNDCDISWFAIPAAAKGWDGTSRVPLSELWLFPFVPWCFLSFPIIQSVPLKLKLEESNIAKLWNLAPLGRWLIYDIKSHSVSGNENESSCHPEVVSPKPLRGKHKLEGVSLG